MLSHFLNVVYNWFFGIKVTPPITTIDIPHPLPNRNPYTYEELADLLHLANTNIFEISAQINLLNAKMAADYVRRQPYYKEKINKLLRSKLEEEHWVEYYSNLISTYYPEKIITNE